MFNRLNLQPVEPMEKSCPMALNELTKRNGINRGGSALKCAIDQCAKLRVVVSDQSTSVTFG